MNLLLGTDIGTSGTKTILMDTGGHLLASDLQEYGVLSLHPLWAEQWPDVWLRAARESIRRTVQRSGCAPADIKGLCISGLYGGSGVPLDREMNPVRPCLIWMDRRASAQQKWVEEQVGTESIRRISKSGTDPYYGYLKMLWIKENEPENWARIRLFLPPNAYVIHRLTGEIAIDYSSAGNIGGIFDMERRRWSDEMLEALGIPRSMLPERLAESSEIVGTLLPAEAETLGLPAGLPVIAGGVDCAVATLGMGVFAAGTYAAAIGTSMCAAFVHEGSPSGGGLIHMPYVYDARRLTYSFGGGATAGAIVRWFRDEFAPLERLAEREGGPDAYAALDRAAAEVPPGSEGLIVLPYFMGERSPIWDTSARGAVVGLTLSHTRAHLYRAFLEAVAFSLRHTIECADTEVGPQILVAGGAAKSPLWRQIIADVTGRSVLCPEQDVEATLGDVILAGVGTGLFRFEDAAHWQTFAPPVQPDPDRAQLYTQYYKVYRALYPDCKAQMAALSNLSTGAR